LLGKLAVLSLLVLANGVFAASEAALISLNKSKVKLYAEQGGKNADKILAASDNISRFLSTIQIGISFIGFVSGAYAADTFADPIVSFLTAKNLPAPNAFIELAAYIAVTFILTYVMLVIGELTPKRIGIDKSIAIARATISVLMALSYVAAPFVKLLDVSTNAVLKLLRVNPESSAEGVTEAEILMLVASNGSIAENEQEMIHNIFEFDNKTVEDACVHRTDVFAVQADADIREVINLIMEENYSRVPVYGENIDDILGILHLKDLMKRIVVDDFNFNLRDIIHEPYYVSFSKKTDEVFQEMKAKRAHMAVVMDEYGGTLGIITMEDLVEEIMGNIFDEHDEDEAPDIDPIDANTFRINGAAELEDVAECLNVNLPDGDYDTLGGFITGLLGYIPADGQTPEVEFAGVLFKAERVREKRIESVIAYKP
jgi:putative hemolysin